MKKVFLMAAVMLVAGCGFMRNATVSVDKSSNNTASTTTTAANAAESAGQGAGNAILGLYNQYKADGNKYDYKNLQNAMNTVTLIANCEGLRENYKDKATILQ